MCTRRYQQVNICARKCQTGSSGEFKNWGLGRCIRTSFYLKKKLYMAVFSINNTW